METTPIDSKRWFDAIRLRRSVRSFTGELTPAERHRLELLAVSLLGDGVRLVLRDAPEKLFSARRLPGATYVAGLLTTKEAPLHRVGFKGEALVLECAAMGLGTCWLGSGYSNKAARTLFEPAKDETLSMLIAIGHPTEPLTAIPDGDRKRKSLERLVITSKGTSLADMEPWQNTALKAARIAPSSLNMQPWRFAFTPGFLCMVASGLFATGAQLDLGIAMLHIELGAATHQMRGVWGQDNSVWIFSLLKDPPATEQTPAASSPEGHSLEGESS